MAKLPREQTVVVKTDDFRVMWTLSAKTPVERAVFDLAVADAQECLENLADEIRSDLVPGSDTTASDYAQLLLRLNPRSDQEFEFELVFVVLVPGGCDRLGLMDLLETYLPRRVGQKINENEGIHKLQGAIDAPRQPLTFEHADPTAERPSTDD